MNIKNQKRRVVLGVTGAVALSNWTKPILNTVILPAHAMTSNNMVAIENLNCLESAPIQLEFSFCNNSSSSITVDSLTNTNLAHISPQLPITVSANSCQNFIVQGANNSVVCGDITANELNYIHN